MFRSDPRFVGHAVGLLHAALRSFVIVRDGCVDGNWRPGMRWLTVNIYFSLWAMPVDTDK